jgi:uncharacterized membrane protein YdbT with pleckstrin-like domain
MQTCFVQGESLMSNHYVQSLLGDRERVLRVTNPHWFVFFRSIVFELVFAAVILAVVIIIRTILLDSPFVFLGLVLLLIPIVGLVQDYLAWSNKEYILTNRRVMQIAGVFNKDVTDSSLEKVNDVKMSQSVLGRIFDFGDIEILTASELGVNKFRMIDHPVEFKTTMINAKEGLSLDHDSFPTRQAVQPQEDVPALIEELGRLREKGILTETEFQAKKAALLSKI